MNKSSEPVFLKRGATRKSDLLLALFRHGPAAERNAMLYPDDDRRPLTAPGRKRVKASARGLRKLGFTPDKLLFSPSVRTRETAAIVAEIFRMAPEAVIMEPSLHADTDPGVLVGKTLRSAQSGKVMWIGHEPWLGEAVGLLTGAGPIALRKAGLVLVDLPQGPRRGPRRKGVLRAVVPPEWLARLGHAG